MTPADALVSFGFTALESEIYVFLLGNSPATGYRVAVGIGKPAANTYKAIQSLQAKGGILVEEGPNRLCRAVPLEELMGRLQKDFESKKAATIKALKNAGKPPEDERIYFLRSRDQIFSRAREMLGVANVVAMVKGSGAFLHGIEADLRKAADRGAAVSALSPEAVAIENIEVVQGTEGGRNQVVVVVDGLQTLVGTIADEAEAEAIWTRSPFLAQIHHEGLSAEIALTNVSHLLKADEKRSRIQRAVDMRRSLPQNRQE
ncbi:MAG: hypothetical protein IT203_08600 [Fimbriimonadaceae bacterium]|nr:hypothetical protein [Fimbriimonadaceae bacterium]